MSKLRKVLIDPRQVKIDPELAPRLDPMWFELADKAMKGTLPVYFAAVPLVLCIPFDLDYRPDLHPIGAAFIDNTIDAWKRNEFEHVIAYPRGTWFVISDDYITLFAALQGRPDYLPCWVLGKPDNDLIRHLRGPIALEQVKTIFTGPIGVYRK